MIIPFDIIDVHNHSLPGTDDGAKNLEMAESMLRVAVSNGTRKIVLTPHHLNTAYRNKARDIEKKVANLQRVADLKNISVELYAGSEVHLVPETVSEFKKGEALSYCGHGVSALIELPKNSIPAGSSTVLSGLVAQGIVPIIAHPERNSVLKKDLSPLREWVEFGCKSQITGQSCTGEFGPDLQNLAFTMIIEGLSHLVASDAHRASGRSPNLQTTAQVLIEHLGLEVAKTLLHENPLRLINGDPILSLSITEGMDSKQIARLRKKYARAKQSGGGLIRNLLGL